MRPTIKLGDIIAKKSRIEPLYIVEKIDDKNYYLRALDYYKIMLLKEKKAGDLVEYDPFIVEFPKHLTLNKRYLDRPEILAKYDIVDTRAGIKKVRRNNQFSNKKNYTNLFVKTKRSLTEPQDRQSQYNTCTQYRNLYL